MHIIKGLKNIRLFLVILVSAIFLTALFFNGCSDDWVYISSSEYFTLYYNPSSVKIYKHNDIVEVLVKKVYTKEGKIDYLKDFEINDKQKYIDIDYSIVLYFINIELMDCSILHTINYSKSDNVLSDIKYDVAKGVKIKPGSICHLLLKNFLKPKWKDTILDSEE